jgi:mono/diheme cytochrome c family protein
MRRWSTITFLILTASVLGTGCSDQGRDPTGPADGDGNETLVSFAQQIQPVFDQNCVGCHGAGGNAGLDLRPDLSHGHLVGVAAQASAGTLVVAGDAAGSVLYQRLTGDGLGIMPPDGALNTTTLDLVRQWIDEGAADN